MKIDYAKVKNAIPDIQTTYKWMVKFDQEDGTSSDIAEKFKNDVTIRCTSTSLPTDNVEHISVQVQGITVKYPGKVDRSGEITLNFVEGTDTKTQDAIFYWKSKYWDAKGKQASAKGLKIKIILTLLDGEDNATATYVLRGCLPGNAPGGELGQDSGSLNPSLTVSYDMFEYKGKNNTWGV